MMRCRYVSYCTALLMCSAVSLLLLHHQCYLDQCFVLPAILIPHYPRTNIHRETNCTTTPLSSKQVAKKFLYMVMTESCLPVELLEVLGRPSECRCDVLVLGYKNKCVTNSTHSHVTHVFAPGTTWATGRALLYNITMETKRNYMYYIFVDDDVKLELYSEVTDSNRNPWRTFEEFLLCLQPPIAAIDTEEWKSVDRIFRFRTKSGCYVEPLPEFVPTVTFDGMVNAFSQHAIQNVLKPVLPVWNRFDEISWWYAQWYVFLMGELVYGRHMILPIELIGRNRQHRSYPRQFETTEIVELIMKDVQGIIPLEMLEGATDLLEEWRTSSYRVRMSGYYTACM